MPYLPTTTDTGHIKMLSWLLFLFKIRCFNAILYFELVTESQKLCVISTQFGPYKYKCVPMGMKQSSDIAQDIMENLFLDIDDIEIYIDDIGCFSSTFSTHIQTLDIILTHLEQNGFTVNPSKCEWAVQETD